MLRSSSPALPLESNYGINLFRITDGQRDSKWDGFLAKHPAGHHVQSSLWSAVKAAGGWSTKRITISEEADLLGGAQLLFRKIKLVGKVGYIPKGPVLIDGKEELAPQLLRKILELAEQLRIRVLFIQPPAYSGQVNHLADFGFASCPVETAPTATSLINLDESFDSILSRMRKGMRNQVRRSQKRGIVVREGTRDDLRTFHRLLTATGNRRGFSTFELSYFESMWDILEPAGWMKLFLSELDGEPVSAQVCVAFGDTVVAKQIGWSGEHRRLHPNEALDWFTIQWAKANDYRYYDLEGIDRPAAQALMDGQQVPEVFTGTPTAYKLRLGGEIQVYPTAYCRVANPLARFIYNRVGSQIADSSLFQKAVGQIRTG